MRPLLYILAQVTVDKNELDIPTTELTSNNVASALRLVFGVAGAIAVLIITIAAFQYVLSQGDPQATAKAKNTIIYALIGLVICLTAFSIVTFVVGRL